MDKIDNGYTLHIYEQKNYKYAKRCLVGESDLTGDTLNVLSAMI